MRRYLLDTTPLTAYLMGRPAAVARLNPWFDRYSIIRRQLRPPHGPGLIGDIDTLIAATAIERNLTVVTCESDYDRVPGLKTLIIPRSEFQRS